MACGLIVCFLFYIILCLVVLISVCLFCGLALRGFKSDLYVYKVQSVALSCYPWHCVVWDYLWHNVVLIWHAVVFMWYNVVLVCRMDLVVILSLVSCDLLLLRQGFYNNSNFDIPVTFCTQSIN